MTILTLSLYLTFLTVLSFQSFIGNAQNISDYRSGNFCLSDEAVNEGAVRSLIVCASICSRNSSCSLFWFNSTTGRCSTASSDVIETISTSSSCLCFINEQKLLSIIADATTFWSRKDIKIFYNFKKSFLNQVNPELFHLQAENVSRNDSGAYFPSSLTSSMRIDNKVNGLNPIDARLWDGSPLSLYVKFRKVMSHTHRDAILLWVSACNMSDTTFLFNLDSSRLAATVTKHESVNYKIVDSDSVLATDDQWRTKSVGLVANSSFVTTFYENGAMVPINQINSYSSGDPKSRLHDCLFLGATGDPYVNDIKTHFTGFFECFAVAQNELKLADFLKLDEICG